MNHIEEAKKLPEDKQEKLRTDGEYLVAVINWCFIEEFNCLPPLIVENGDNTADNTSTLCWVGLGISDGVTKVINQVAIDRTQDNYSQEQLTRKIKEWKEKTYGQGNTDA